MQDYQLRQQRDFERIALVSGIGNPQADTACLMSLVARLAAEGHTDRPRCASPLIGAFVIPVNDRMPDAARRRLKPFAPRIIGTRDGRDAARTALLRSAMAGEVLPAIISRQAARQHRLPVLGGMARAWATMQRATLHGQVLRLIDETAAPGRPDRGIALAHASGLLLALCAGLARDPQDADAYWDTAIGLLDRMCDAGRAEAPHPAPAGRMPEPVPG